MENKKLMLFGILLLFFGIFSVIVFSEKLSAVSDAVVCCEKTTGANPAWCQEVTDVNDCDTSGDLRNAPTSCESTSYCKVGTCVNTIEGLCMENTAQKVCEDAQAAGVEVAAGVWYDSPSDELNQCQLGCCLIGDQASFTTQTRCKQLSSEYGLETNYRSDIQSESQCIRSATPNVHGACVFEEEFQNTCRFITREECQNLENSGIGDVEFNAGFLCSAEQLGTNCGPSEKTTILDGKDEVYFVDTCGNPANIYDANRQDEADCTSGSSSSCGYWEKTVPKILSCSLGDSNNPLANQETCGNCNYYLGSTGKLYDRLKDGLNNAPDFGDYICRDLSCGDVDGETRDHGETWCVNSASSDNLKNLPGSRDFRKVCYNGEVTIEACADYRQELCIEDSIGDFSTAACRANLWQDCVAQTNSKDCNNVDKRDCIWLGAAGVSKCAPRNPPGFDFWEPETDAVGLCAQASNNCEVKFVEGLSGVLGNIAEGVVGGENKNPRCIENCDCLPETLDSFGNALYIAHEDYGGPPIGSRLKEMETMCVALGDCGVSSNYIGEAGYYTLWKELISITEKPEEEDSGGILG